MGFNSAFKGLTDIFHVYELEKYPFKLSSFADTHKEI
jgi:hypothetical protein